MRTKLSSSESVEQTIVFYVISSCLYPIILGLPWLCDTNPAVDWSSHVISFARTPSSPSSHLLSHASDFALPYSYVANQTIPPEYADFADVFAKSSADKLPPSRPGFDLAIDLMPNTNPPYLPIYSLAPPELTTLKDYIDDMLAKGFIRISQSPAGAPVMFVPKPDNTLRLCVDFRKLNAITVKDRTSLPLTKELLSRLSKDPLP